MGVTVRDPGSVTCRVRGKLRVTSGGVASTRPLFGGRTGDPVGTREDGQGVLGCRSGLPTGTGGT